MKWLIAIFLISSGATAVTLLPELQHDAGCSDDPIVETVQREENRISHIARFAPRIGQSGDVEYNHKFTWKNSGVEPIIVTSSSKSCSCFKAEIDRDEILAGETAAIAMSIKPSNLFSKEGSFTVETESGQQHSYQMRTWTYPPVSMERGTESRISFGLLTPGSRQTTHRKLYVYAQEDEVPPELQWKPNEEIEKPPVICQLTDLGVEPFHDGRLARRTYDLEISVDVGKVSQLVYEKINFEPVSSDADEYNYTATVIWNVGSSIRITPARWVVRRREVTDQETLQNTLTLEGLDGLPKRVTEVHSSHESLKAEPPRRKSGEILELPIILDLKSVPMQGYFLATLEIECEVMEASRSLTVRETFSVIVVD